MDPLKRKEDLQKLAALVRTYAKKVDEEKTQKVASLLVAATGLNILENKLRG